MRWFETGLSSSVGRRLLAVFCISSLLPLSVFALVSYLKVYDQIEEQTSERLHRTTKSAAHLMVGQLLNLTEELRAIAAKTRAGGPYGDLAIVRAEHQHFLSVAIQRDGGVLTPILGELPPPVDLPHNLEPHLATGRSVLISVGDRDHKIVMALAVDPTQPLRAILLACPEPSYVFALDALPLESPGTSFLLLDEHRRLIYSSAPITPTERDSLLSALAGSPEGEFRWTSKPRRLLSYSWSIPLTYEFLTPPWTIIRTENAASVFASAEGLRRDFVLLTGIALLVALFMSSIQIRRNLHPLEALTEGTRRIAGGDFAGRVKISSGDEFEDLARSFNAMSDEIEGLHLSTLTALARTVDAKSPWTAGHSERVCRLAVAVGRQLGLGVSELVTLQRGALLHDIGKIGVPAHLLDKPGRLTSSEKAIVDRHPETGARILEPIKAFEAAIHLVRNHHERLDGQGYPDRLAGDAIPEVVRILSVADAFDAMVTDRPYREGMSLSDAAHILRREAGRQFDPRAVEALLELLGRPGFVSSIFRGRVADADPRSEFPNRPESAQPLSSWEVQ